MTQKTAAQSREAIVAELIGATIMNVGDVDGGGLALELSTGRVLVVQPQVEGQQLLVGILEVGTEIVKGAPLN